MGHDCHVDEIVDLASELAALDFHPRLIAHAVRRAADSVSDRGAYEDAAVLYDLACRYDEHAAVSLRALGTCYRILGEKEKAFEVFERARASHPQDTGLLYQWGVALGKFADESWDADAEFRRTGLGDKPYLRAYFYAGVGRGLAFAGRPKDGVECVREAIRAVKSWAPAHAHLASILESEDKHAEAVRALGEAISISPGRTEWISRIATSLALLYEPQEATERYEKLVGRPVGGRGREFDIGLAGGYLRRWQHEHVATLIKRIELDPTYRASGSYLRGVIALRSGDLAKAHEHLEKTRARMGRASAVLASRASVLSGLGRHEQAAVLYARAAHYAKSPDLYRIPRALCQIQLSNWGAVDRLLAGGKTAMDEYLRSIVSESKSLDSRRAKLLEGKLGSAGSEEEALRWAGVAWIGGEAAVALKYYRRAKFPEAPPVRAAHLLPAIRAALVVAGSEANANRATRAYGNALAWLANYIAILERMHPVEQRAVYSALRSAPESNWLRNELVIEQFPKRQQDEWRALRKQVLAGHTKVLRFR